MPVVIIVLVVVILIPVLIYNSLYILSEGYTQTRSLYAGHFVDNVIAPIYNIVQKVRAWKKFAIARQFPNNSLTQLSFDSIFVLIRVEHGIEQRSSGEAQLR